MILIVSGQALRGYQDYPERKERLAGRSVLIV
jgi:hypothetical protein